MHSTQKAAVAIGLAAMCAVELAAQTQEAKTPPKTKIEINGGKDVTVTGCLERGPKGDYRLTEVRENRRGAPSRYALLTDEDLSMHVGERVEIKGKAVVNGKGKVSVESETQTEVGNDKDRETKTTTVGTSGALHMPYLGVKSMKTLSSSCN
jgi:hypothetical protein